MQCLGGGCQSLARACSLARWRRLAHPCRDLNHWMRCIHCIEGKASVFQNLGVG